MSLSNLPPGCDPNDPHLSGIWPIEQVVDKACEDLKKAMHLIEDVSADLDDQSLLSPEVELQIDDATNSIQKAINECNMLIPEEPEYDDYYHGIDPYEDGRP